MLDMGFDHDLSLIDVKDVIDANRSTDVNVFPTSFSMA
jgi:hypothetical protein